MASSEGFPFYPCFEPSFCSLPMAFEELGLNPSLLLAILADPKARRGRGKLRPVFLLSPHLCRRIA